MSENEQTEPSRRERIRELMQQDPPLTIHEIHELVPETSLQYVKDQKAHMRASGMHVLTDREIRLARRRAAMQK